MKFNLKAFIAHFIFSIGLVSFFAVIILTFWYPSIWSKALGGYDLFIKIIIFDLFAGPICMGLVYKSHKRMREKIVDVAVITCAQLAFLVYGLHVLYDSRPAFIVFANESFYVYVANEIEDEDLGDEPPYNKIGITGPVYAAVDMAKVDEDDKLNAIFTGKDVTNIPHYYEDLNALKVRIDEVRNPYGYLPDNRLKVEMKKFIEAEKMNENEVYWLPVRHRFGFVTAILKKDRAQPVGYLNLDPYDYAK